jgi:RNA polymerase sigma factor (sigma-70 family)
MAPPCDDISDFELIRRMADEQANFAEARGAWGHFYVRHHRFLLRVCMADHRYVLGAEEVKDVVQHAFFRAFDGAKTFHYTEDCPSVIQERKSRGWLIQIAENLVRDRFRNKPEVSLLDDNEIDRLTSTADAERDNDSIPESERLQLLRAGFILLSDVEQTVLRATMFWWQGDQQHQRMPHSALLELSKQTGKSPANIRQIRARAVKKLEKYVNENIQDEKAN